MRSDVDYTAVDEVFARCHAEGSQPGLAYGVVQKGELVHSGGFGQLDGSGSSPDADSVFRIASITKSFTAAAALVLRDEGVLRLDDEAVEYLPEMAASRGPTSDSAAPTLRDLLTMNAGFPTDDAWADRLLDLAPAEFEAFLRRGPRFARAPGVAFEYSNLGYAIMGRVIAVATGADYGDVIVDRLLRPLELSSTSFAVSQATPRALAHGYRQVDNVWQEVPFAGDGAFASMGGLYSSVRDLSRWVGGFTDAFPPRDAAEGRHPLTRAARREMQQAQRVIAPPLDFLDTRDALSLAVGGYGYGLFVAQDPQHGAIVGHPGGLPGFGSCILWQPDAGVGVVTLANATYAPVCPPTMMALDALLSSAPSSVSRTAPWPETLTARSDIIGLLTAWDADVAAATFAANVDMDDPITRRRAAIERLRQELGGLEPDSSTPIEVRTPASVAWWMKGSRGRARFEIEMTPERPPRVQTLAFSIEGQRDARRSQR